MDANEREARLAEALAEFHRRRALGESPDPEEYRGRLGEAFEEFRDVLEASAAIQDVVEPFSAPTLPYRFGRYTLTRRLGQGAMGVVFEALDEHLGRKVAVKVLRTGFDLDGTAFERMSREAKACSQVKHPSVVTVHDAGAHEGRLYYTMDIVPGASLSARIRSGDLPPTEALVRGFAGIADALHALHSHKPDAIVHRDVKPSNIIVMDDGSMVLADFGLARTAASETLTRTGDALGTPLYMSPEQVLGQRDQVDARSDVYGLGATMFEALTGRPPFLGQELADLLGKISSERPQFGGAGRRAIPKDLQKVVLMALEKRREDRHQSAAQLRDELLRVADGIPVESSPVGRMRRAGRWAVAHAPLLAAGLAILLAGAWMWTQRDGTVVFTLGPGWEVEVADRGVVRAAEVLPLAPGRYVATAVVPPEDAKDLKAEPTKFSVEPGATVRVDLDVKWLTPAGQERLLARNLGLDRVPVSTNRNRGAGRDVLWPRGVVRPEDLDEWAVALRYGEDLGKELTLRFERGDEILGEVTLLPKDEYETGPVPAKVRESVRVGDRLRVRIQEGRRNELASATVRVEDRPEVAQKLEAALAKAGDVDPVVQASIVARALLSAGLPGPALRVAREVEAAKRTPTLWAVLLTASDQTGVDAPAALEGADDVIEELRVKSPAEFDRVIRLESPR